MVAHGRTLTDVHSSITTYEIQYALHDSPSLYASVHKGSRGLQDKFHEAIINLSNSRIEHHVRLGPNTHGNGDTEEIKLFEKAALEDEGVKAEIAKLRLPEGTVIVCDPWIYGENGAH